MSSDIERWEPPNEATAFESLSLDLWKDIWQDSGAQKNGRSGQAEAGVDVFGRDGKRLIGVQCKQKDGRLRARLTAGELQGEVEAARSFTPKLTKFILATTGHRDTKVQQRARELTAEHARQKLFTVEVWAWEDIWHELYRRKDLFRRVAPIYWPARAALPPPPPQKTVKAYRQQIFKECRHPALDGIDPAAADKTSDSDQLDLAEIYTALDTTALRPVPKASRTAKRALPVLAEMDPQREETEPLPALDALIAHRRLVLLGDPGSGKSTFVRFLSLCLAGHALDPKKSWLKRLGGWPAEEANLVPITIELRKFAQNPPRPLVGAAEPDDLWRYIEAEVTRRKVPALAGPLREMIENGQAIVCFDGLDEIQETAHKEFVRDAIVKFCEPPFDACRVVVTCRTRSYRDGVNPGGSPRYKPWHLPGWPDFELRDFDREKIRQFIELWFGENLQKKRLSPEEAAHHSHDLFAAIQERTHLQEVAGVPMLLTVMACVHQHDGELPRTQALLYNRIVELLLFRWKSDVGTGSGRLGLRPLLAEKQITERAFLRALSQLAYDATHGQREAAEHKQPADIQVDPLRNALAKLPSADNPDWNWAERVIQAIQYRAGLLRSTDDKVFAFPHRSFQEFLAGAHLAAFADFPREAAKLIEADPAYWRETVKWAAGRLAHVHQTPRPVRDLARRLTQTARDGDSSPAARQKLILAAEILTDADAREIAELEDGDVCLGDTRACLLREGTNEKFPGSDRAAAGLALGRLGDVREGVGRRPDGFPDIAWSDELPAGEFTLGETRQPAKIEDPFHLSRYPVTVAQYQAFVDAGGYRDAGKADDTQLLAWWGKEGLKWKRAEKRAGPEDYDPAFQTPNHPRVGVSWYEAMAFCRWLSEQSPHKITLPAEAQWEWAARWNEQTRQADDRLYPWGDEEKDLAQRCNMRDTGIGHTSAVGLFPSGKADCGAMDLSGNVWEWCENLYEQDQPFRVLRGGSWVSDDPARLRCAYRYVSVPGIRVNLIGFRVVWLVGCSARR